LIEYFESKSGKAVIHSPAKTGNVANDYMVQLRTVCQQAKT